MVKVSECPTAAGNSITVRKLYPRALISLAASNTQSGCLLCAEPTCSHARWKRWPHQSELTRETIIASCNGKATTQEEWAVCCCRQSLSFCHYIYCPF